MAFYAVAVQAGADDAGVCAAAQADGVAGYYDAGKMAFSAAAAAAAGGAGAYVDAEAVLAAASVGDAYAGTAVAGAVAVLMPLLGGLYDEVSSSLHGYVSACREVAAAHEDVACACACFWPVCVSAVRVSAACFFRVRFRMRLRVCTGRRSQQPDVACGAG